jgi:hypothetical protein
MCVLPLLRVGLVSGPKSAEDDGEAMRKTVK